MWADHTPPDAGTRRGSVLAVAVLLCSLLRHRHGFRMCPARLVEQQPVATAVHAVLGGTPLAQSIARPLAAYVLQGNFDVADVMAIAVGALAAALVLRRVDLAQEQAHAT